MSEHSLKDKKNAPMDITVGGKKFIVTASSHFVTHADPISGYAGLSSSIVLTATGAVQLQNPWICCAAALGVMANSLLIVGKRIPYPTLSNNVSKGASAFFGTSSLCYIGTYVFGHAPFSLAALGVTSLVGSAANLLLRKRQNFPQPKTIAGACYLLTSTSIWATAVTWIHNPAAALPFAAAALLSTVSSIAFMCPQQEPTLRLNTPEP